MSKVPNPVVELTDWLNDVLAELERMRETIGLVTVIATDLLDRAPDEVLGSEA